MKFMQMLACDYEHVMQIKFKNFHLLTLVSHELETLSTDSKFLSSTFSSCRNFSFGSFSKFPWDY